MLQRNIYSNFLKTTALVFSFCSIAGQSHAMEPEEYGEGWWGARIKGHAELNFSTQGDLFTLDAPLSHSASGLTGRIAVPVLSVHVPKEGELSFLSLLQAKPPMFEVDTLYINGRQVNCPNPFRGGEFRAYELTLNGQNLGQPFTLFTPLKALKDEYLQHFASIIQLLEPEVRRMDESSKDLSGSHFKAKLQNPIKSHLNSRNRELTLSRIKCTSSGDHSGQFNGPDKLDELRDNFNKGFLPFFKEFNAPHKTYRKINYQMMGLALTPCKLWVSGAWKEEDYNLYIKNGRRTSKQIKNFDQMINQIILVMDESNTISTYFDLALGICSLKDLIENDKISKDYWLELFCDEQ